MFSLIVRHYLLLATLLLLASCQTQPVLITDPESQRQALENLNTFRVTGGLGVWTDAESISTRIQWQQAGDAFDLLIQLPAGLSTVRVTQKDGLAILVNGGAAPVTANSASMLLAQALKLSVAVPIEQMSQWIKGLPGEQAQSVKYDAQGRLESMLYVDDANTQWRAKVLKYSQFNDTVVPATILATGGPYTIRLVLKEWHKDLTSADITGEQNGRASIGGSGRLKVPNR